MKDESNNSDLISEEAFLESKLFNEALSKPTSHYIQSKLMSLPSNEAQDLKKLDLRHMCDTVVQELQVVQKQAAYDYIKVSQELQQLGGELSVADGIMGQLQNVLLDFKGHLQSIKNQMTSLQQKSNQMNTSLSNRKKLHNMLNSFIDNAVIDKQLIDAICLQEINDNYVIHIKNLLKKLSYLNNATIGTDSKTVKQLQPQLQKLKSKASIRLRQFLLQKIATLKKPKANINILQKNVLLKYKVFTQFFKDHYPTIFTQICNAYRETMAKIYLNNYKTYLNQIYKLQTQLYIKTDQVLPSDPQYIRTFIQQTKPTTLNQGTKTIFTLMNRDKIIDQSEQSDVILYNATTVKNQRFSIQQVFKSVNKVLMDGVLSQIVFTAQFFNIKSDGACQLFGPIFRPALNSFIDHIKSTMAYTYDLNGILVILAINEKNKTYFRQREFKALQFYFDQVSMIIWPKFEQIFDFHLKPLLNFTPKQYRMLEKSSSNKILISRFSDFVISLYRLCDHFMVTNMVMVRLQNFRKAFFELQKKIKEQNNRQTDGLNQYLSFLEQFHSGMSHETNIKNKDFLDEMIRLQKQIGMISDKIVTGYIRQFFPNLDSFIVKYCKQQQGINDEGIFQISKNIDNKIIDSLINDLSGQPFISTLQKLVSFCEKKYSGYSLKSLLKKFLSVFMKFYTQIYKHVKNYHPQSASMMLQPHNAMKEIKTAFGKHIS